jgi:hypothetical protein
MSPGSKLYYDGSRLYIDANIGILRYTNLKTSTVEEYVATRIELHYPSEHYIVKGDITNRYDLELQIIHELKSTSNPGVTNEKIKVKQAIISMMFTEGASEFDEPFLGDLGISGYNRNDVGGFITPAPKTFISRTKPTPGLYDYGINYMSFQSLQKLLNADSQIYFYYGSQTVPPCQEDVLWMIYSAPRSISKSQIEYLMATLTKNKQGIPIEQAKLASELYGNKRSLIVRTFLTIAL